MKYFLLLISFCAGASCFSQIHKFQKLFDNPSSPGLATMGTIIATNDNGLALTGAYGSYSGGGNNRIFLKLDSLGVVTISNELNPISGNLIGTSIRQLNDSGFIVGGINAGFGSCSQAMSFERFDKNGNTIWNYYFCNSSQPVTCNDILQTPDSGFLGVGMALSKGSLFKLDKNGNLLWDTLYNNTINFQRIIQISGGDYIVIGQINNVFGQLVARFSPSGTNIWAYTFVLDEIRDLVNNSDNTFEICGSFVDNSSYSYSYPVIAKIDYSGNVVWAKSYFREGYDWGFGLAKARNDGFVVASFSYDTTNWLSKPAIIRLDSSGNFQWGKTYLTVPENFSNCSYFVTGTNDGGYALSGNGAINSQSAGVYVIKTDSLGSTGSCNDSSAQYISSPFTLTMTNAGPLTVPGGLLMNVYSINIASNPFFTELDPCSISTGQANSSQFKNQLLMLAPNPANSFICIQNNFSEKVNFELFSYEGRKIKSVLIYDSIQQIDISELSNGIYLFEIKNNQNQVVRGKLIVEK